MNILITGITGFVGSHMADYILKNTNDKIFGIKRWMEDTKNIDHLIDNPRLTLYGGDLLDYASIDRAVRLSKPDKVFSSILSPQSNSPSSFLGSTKPRLDFTGVGWLGSYLAGKHR